MARVVVNPPPAQHEDWAIVSFNHIPDFALHFGPVREILHEFLEDHNHIEVRKTQPSHLGRALVCLVNAHDRDLLVNQSPHDYGDVQIHFLRHNQDRNWRALTFNRDCWLMLLGFPLDHWNHDSIKNAIDSFGKAIPWKKDLDYRARLLVHARVTDLVDVPHFIVLT
jgi:hypothetical protein